MTNIQIANAVNPYTAGTTKGIDRTISNPDDYQDYATGMRQSVYNYKKTLENDMRILEEAGDTNSQQYKDAKADLEKLNTLNIRDLYGLKGFRGSGTVSGNDSQEDNYRTIEAFLQGVHTLPTPKEKFDKSKSRIKRVKHYEMEEEPAPEPTPPPQAQPQQAPSQRLTTDTTPAEFKPALMEKEKAKTEEEYLGKDRSKWANMSTADKVAGLAGLLGDAGGDIVDIVAAAQGIENGGAERLKKRRDEINQRREERKKEYQEYLNRVDDINRQIAMHNNNTINNSAMAKFNADNAYRMINYQAQQQAAAQAKAGLYM